jgi:hypothetical protein
VKQLVRLALVRRLGVPNIQVKVKSFSGISGISGQSWTSRRDRFAAPAEVWSQLHAAMPHLLDA